MKYLKKFEELVSPYSNTIGVVLIALLVLDIVL
jgi:hypothetical protein